MKKPTLVSELCLSVRTSNVLRNFSSPDYGVIGSGIETIGDLLTKTPADLMRQPNFGKTSLRELKEELASHGLYLAHDLDGPFVENYKGRSAAIVKLYDEYAVPLVVIGDVIGVTRERVKQIYTRYKKYYGV